MAPTAAAQLFPINPRGGAILVGSLDTATLALSPQQTGAGRTGGPLYVALSLQPFSINPRGGSILPGTDAAAVDPRGGSILG